MAWLGTAETTGTVESLIFQLNVIAVEMLNPSLALTVTAYGFALADCGVSVPVISPVLTLIVSPGGRPAALYFKVSLSASLAAIWSETTSPSLLAWFGTGATTGEVKSLIVQLNVSAVEVLNPSVELTVTAYGVVAAD